MTTTRELSLRVFEPRDIARIAWGVERYLPELPHYKNIFVDKEWLTYLLHRYHGQPQHFQGWVLVDEDDVVHGGAAGIATIGFFVKRPVVTDVFLFVEEGWRSLINQRLLMRAYRQWALALDPIIVTATTTGGHRPELFDAMMVREGYTKVGSLFHLRTDKERF